MIYIEGLGYIEDKTGNYNKQTKSDTPSVSFDSILSNETIIYAVPNTETTNIGATEKVSPTTTISVPEDMEAYFDEAAKTYGVSKDVLIAIAKTESNFNASAVSSAGAMGVMQLMPETASYLGVENPYNARENIMGGAKYISNMLKQYDQNLSLALAAYNAGPGNVNRYGGIPPFTETQNYVSKVLSYLGTTDSEHIASNDTKNTDNSANTIYAVASKDASSTVVAHSVKAVPYNN